MSVTLLERLREFNKKNWLNKDEAMNAAMDLISDAADEIEKQELLVGDYTKALVDALKAGQNVTSFLGRLCTAMQQGNIQDTLADLQKIVEELQGADTKRDAANDGGSGDGTGDGDESVGC